MPILIECPNCHSKLRVQDDLVGRRVKCPSCGTAFTGASVSAPQGASRAPAAAPPPTPAAPPPSPLDSPPPPPPPEEVEYTGDEGGDYPADDDRQRRARKKKRRAGERVKLPAIFMIILAILGLLSTLIATILTVAGAGVMTKTIDDPNFQRGFNQAPQPNPRFGQNPPGFGQNPRTDPEMINKMKSAMAGAGIMAVVIGIVGALLQGLMLFGSIQMLRLKTYGLAVTAAILCMVSGLCASFGTVSLALSATVATMGLAGVPSMCCCAGGLIFLPLDVGVGIWALVVLMSADVKAAFA